MAIPNSKILNGIILENCAITDVAELMRNKNTLIKWTVSLAEELMPELTDEKKAAKIGMSTVSYRYWKGLIKKEKEK